MGCCLNHELLNKAKKIFKVHSVEFCFLTRPTTRLFETIINIHLKKKFSRLHNEILLSKWTTFKICFVTIKTYLFRESVSCSVVSDPMDCSLPGSSVHGILQARILEVVASPFSRGFSQPRDRTWVSCIAGRFFTSWVTRKAQFYSG